MKSRLNLKINPLFLIMLIISAMFFGLFSPKSAFADTFNLSGRISDSSGNAISGSSVDVIEANTNNNVANTSSDNSGNYSVNIAGGKYDVHVTPPTGSNFSPVIALSQIISTNTVLNFVLTPVGTVTLSGHVYDSLGNPLPGQEVKMEGAVSAGTTTGESGNYFLQVPAGSYTIRVDDVLVYSPTYSILTVPRYDITADYSLTQSTILDIHIPVKKVTVHAQDASSNPVSGVGILAAPQGNYVNQGGLSIGGNITNASADSSSYYSGPVTGSSGDTVVWLLSNNNGNTYKFIANPPGGSSFVLTNLSNVSITDDTTITITMQQPVTLSGHVYDSLGNPLPGQEVKLEGLVTASSNTDTSGSYSIQVPAGGYNLRVDDVLVYSPTYSILTVPKYDITAGYSIAQSTVLDIHLPFKKVTVHVHDASSNPVSGVSILVAPSDLGGTVNAGGLSIGGNIINASADSSSYYSGPQTNSSGDTVVWLLPNNNGYTYKFIATPHGGGFVTTNLSNIPVTEDTAVTITMEQPVTLSGHIYDSLGNPLGGQEVHLEGAVSAVTNTGESGNYFIQVPAGEYTLRIDNINLSLNSSSTVPIYDITAGYSLTQSTVLDITIPAKRVTVHVQDASSNPVSGVGILAASSSVGGDINSGGLSIGDNITNASSDRSDYHFSQTDSSGNTVVWLLPNNGGRTYKFIANPLSGSIYSAFTLQNVSITSDQTEIISLQFIHDRPITTATLSPAPNAQGEYSDPTTVTLSATAASGFTIVNTYYTVDGGSQQTYSSPFHVSGEGAHIITFWSIDNVGVFEAPNTQTFTIYINQPADINIIPNATISEGDTYSKDGSFTDPDSTSWTATVDYGDEGGVQPLSLNPDKTFSLSHLYKDNKPNNAAYTITVKITDNQGATGTGTTILTVNNIPPTVGAITAPANPLQVNTAVTASANFTDKGVLDSHTAIWDWGDGKTNSGTVTELNGSGSVSDPHNYTAAGVYTIILTVTDKDGGVGTSRFQYVVIYDPSAGFVTGGGTITSPTGAYTKYPTLSGKANFGFVSKYQNGAKVPTGNTEFQFKMANFNFHSTSYDWLVVGGARAQYKGSGTVNGTGNYAFILTAIDGQVSGGGETDKFRIKIWDKATGKIIYDNQTGASDTADPITEIDNGSIVIHH